MSDMRKWINLLEDEEGHWYTDKELNDHFITPDNQVHWYGEFIYVPDHEYLYVAQDAFQKYMRWHLKPAWITDVRIEDSPIPRERNISWKVTTGQNDPDE